MQYTVKRFRGDKEITKEDLKQIVLTGPILDSVFRAIEASFEEMRKKRG